MNCFELVTPRTCLPKRGVTGGHCPVHVADEGAYRWAVGRIEGLMPSSDGKRGRPFRDHRQVVEGIIYRYRTGIAWRDLSREFGPWQTVWKRHRRLAGDGTWDKVHAALLSEADVAGRLGWQVSVDSTVNRAHKHGTNLTRTEHGTGGILELQESAGRAG
jgi:transposase